MPALHLTWHSPLKHHNSHRESGTPIDRDIAWNIFSNICGALAFCHHGIRSPHDPSPPPTWSAIIHRDMKTDNIFLQSDPTAPGGIIAILGDFGNQPPSFFPRNPPNPFYLTHTTVRLVNQPLPRANHLPPPHRRQQLPVPRRPAVAAAREPALHHGQRRMGPRCHRNVHVPVGGVAGRVPSQRRWGARHVRGRPAAARTAGGGVGAAGAAERPKLMAGDSGGSGWEVRKGIRRGEGGQGVGAWRFRVLSGSGSGW